MRAPVACVLLATFALVQSPAPDLVVANARVFTGSVSQPWAEAISVKGDRIAAVGTTAEIAKTAGSATKTIDAGGRLLIPGINDAHTHISIRPAGTVLEGPPAIEKDPTLAEVLTRLRAAAATAPPGGWIYGEIGGTVLGDPRVTRATLDRLTGDRPVLLRAWTGHGTIANTAALRALGIKLGLKDEEPNPPGGTFVRTADGSKLTGLAHEYADYLIGRRLAALAPKTEQLRAFTAYARDAAGYGITSSQIMMTTFPIDVAAGLLGSAEIPIRLRLIDFPMIAMAAWRAPADQAKRNSLITISGVKWILDGTPVERMMFLRGPYADLPQWRGHLNFSEADLRGFFERALAAKVQPMLHAVGDAAVGAVLDGLEATGGERWKPLRPRLEHGDMLQSADFARAARMGVTLVQNPSHFTIGDIVQARLGAERAQRMFQVKAALAAGVPFALGSDGPMNPFLNIMFAATNAANPSQALTVQQALTAYTAGSAAAELAESEKGTLKPGMLADFALLSQDIFKVARPELPKTVSVLTVVNGRIVHSRLE
jgi:predicted amidohydrolase YtcJ